MKDCIYLYKAKLLRVIDGDTYEFMIDLGFDIQIKRKVRLVGTDTPETFRPTSFAEKYEGLKIKKEITNIFNNAKEIYIKPINKGKYGRVIAEVIIIPKKDEFYIDGKKVKYNKIELSKIIDEFGQEKPEKQKKKKKR